MDFSVSSSIASGLDPHTISLNNLSEKIEQLPDTFVSISNVVETIEKLVKKGIDTTDKQIISKLITKLKDLSMEDDREIKLGNINRIAEDMEFVLNDNIQIKEAYSLLQALKDLKNSVYKQENSSNNISAGKMINEHLWETVELYKNNPQNKDALPIALIAYTHNNFYIRLQGSNDVDSSFTTPEELDNFLSNNAKIPYHYILLRAKPDHELQSGQYGSDFYVTANKAFVKSNGGKTYPLIDLILTQSFDEGLQQEPTLSLPSSPIETIDEISNPNELANTECETPISCLKNEIRNKLKDKLKNKLINNHLEKFVSGNVNITTKIFNAITTAPNVTTTAPNVATTAHNVVTTVFTAKSFMASPNRAIIDKITIRFPPILYQPITLATVKTALDGEFRSLQSSISTISKKSLYTYFPNQTLIDPTIHTFMSIKLQNRFDNINTIRSSNIIATTSTNSVGRNFIIANPTVGTTPSADAIFVPPPPSIDDIYPAFGIFETINDPDDDKTDSGNVVFGMTSYDSNLRGYVFIPLEPITVNKLDENGKSIHDDGPNTPLTRVPIIGENIRLELIDPSTDFTTVPYEPKDWINLRQPTFLELKNLNDGSDEVFRLFNLLKSRPDGSPLNISTIQPPNFAIAPRPRLRDITNILATLASTASTTVVSSLATEAVTKQNELLLEQNKLLTQSLSSLQQISTVGTTTASTNPNISITPQDKNVVVETFSTPSDAAALLSSNTLSTSQLQLLSLNKQAHLVNNGGKVLESIVNNNQSVNETIGESSFINHNTGLPPPERQSLIAQDLLLSNNEKTSANLSTAMTEFNDVTTETQKLSLLSLNTENRRGFNAPTAISIEDRKVNNYLSDYNFSIAQTSLFNRDFFRRILPKPVYGFNLTNINEKYIVTIVMPDSTKPNDSARRYNVRFVNMFNVGSTTHVKYYNMMITVPCFIYTDAHNIAHENTSYNNKANQASESEFDNINLTTYNYLDRLTGNFDQYLSTHVPYIAKSIPRNIFIDRIFNPLTFIPAMKPLPRIFALRNEINTLPNDFNNRNLELTVDQSSKLYLLPSYNITSFISDKVFIRLPERVVPEPIFAFGRRHNDKVDYVLLQLEQLSTSASIYTAIKSATNPEERNVGRIINTKLAHTSDPKLNKTTPAQLYAFTKKLGDRNYVGDVHITTVSNVPYSVAITNTNEFYSFSLTQDKSIVGSTDVTLSTTNKLKFPTEIYNVGETSTTLTSVDPNDSNITSESLTRSSTYRLVSYKNLVYLIRAVDDALLIDTYIATVNGELSLNSEPRFRRSRLKFFGNSYTPVTFEDTLDNLDIKDINNYRFFAPTIRIPINSLVPTDGQNYTLDPTKGFVANISNFVGEIIWTFVVALKPVATNTDIPDLNFRLLKLHYIYDDIVTLYSPIDFTYKYPIKQAEIILNLTRTAIAKNINNTFKDKNPLVDPITGKPSTASDAIRNERGLFPLNADQKIKDWVSLDGVSYFMEESALNYTSLNQVSAVSSIANMLVSVMFEYTDTTPKPKTKDSYKAMVLLNGYLTPGGYKFTDANNFDVNQIGQMDLAMLEQNAKLHSQNISFHDIDANIPKDYWPVTFDPVLSRTDDNGNTIQGLNPTLVLQANNEYPDKLNTVDTYASVVSTNVHLRKDVNNTTGSIFLVKKAERNILNLKNATPSLKDSLPVFYLIARDHYNNLGGAKLTFGKEKTVQDVSIAIQSNITDNKGMVIGSLSGAAVGTAVSADATITGPITGFVTSDVTVTGSYRINSGTVADIGKVAGNLNGSSTGTILGAQTGAGIVNETIDGIITTASGNTEDKNTEELERLHANVSAENMVFGTLAPRKTNIIVNGMTGTVLSGSVSDSGKGTLTASLYSGTIDLTNNYVMTGDQKTLIGTITAGTIQNNGDISDSKFTLTILNKAVTDLTGYVVTSNNSTITKNLIVATFNFGSVTSTGILTGNVNLNISKTTTASSVNINDLNKYTIRNGNNVYARFDNSSSSVTGVITNKAVTDLSPGNLDGYRLVAPDNLVFTSGQINTSNNLVGVNVTSNGDSKINISSLKGYLIKNGNSLIATINSGSLLNGSISVSPVTLPTVTPLITDIDLNNYTLVAPGGLDVIANVFNTTVTNNGILNAVVKFKDPLSVPITTITGTLGPNIEIGPVSGKIVNGAVTITLTTTTTIDANKVIVTGDIIDPNNNNIIGKLNINFIESTVSIKPTGISGDLHTARGTDIITTSGLNISTTEHLTNTQEKTTILGASDASLLGTKVSKSPYTITITSKDNIVLESIILDDLSVVIDPTKQTSDPLYNTVDSVKFAAAINTKSNYLYAIVDKSAAGTPINLFISATNPSNSYNFDDVNGVTFETGGYNAYVTAVQEQTLENFSGAFTKPINNLPADEAAINNLVTNRGDFTVEFWHSIPKSDNGAGEIFTLASPDNSLIKYIDIDLDKTGSYIIVNNTKVKANTIYPTLVDNWRHVAVTYAQPYTIQFKGNAGFEVPKASNYDLSQDFTLAVTAAFTNPSNDINGLIYKGTGNANTPQEVKTSYAFYLDHGKPTLVFFDGAGNKKTIQTQEARMTIPDNADSTKPQYYQLLVSKSANTTNNNSSGSPNNPYTLPFDLKQLTDPKTGNSDGGASFNSGNDNGKVSVSGFRNSSTSSKLSQFNNNISNQAQQSYTITFEVRKVNVDGTYGAVVQEKQTVNSDPNNSKSLMILTTGNNHLLFGEVYDENNSLISLNGFMRRIYIFSNAINSNNLNTLQLAELSSNGLKGYWKAAYDVNNVLNNVVNAEDGAISTSSSSAKIMPLLGNETEGLNLYINGGLMTLTLVAPDPGNPINIPTNKFIRLNATTDYRMAEIAFWSETRQSFEVQDDLFGRLVKEILPNLRVYIPAVYTSAILQAYDASLYGDKPDALRAYVQNIVIRDEIGTLKNLSNSDVDLAGPPTLGRLGPLVTPNLDSPPGVGFIQADTPPNLATYSFTTVNPDTGLFSGEIREVYVYLKGTEINLFVGHKVGDLQLTWVSQEQGDVQLMGYIEGPPPVPMANLTVKGDYKGASSLTFKAATGISYKYTGNRDDTSSSKFTFSDGTGIKAGLKTMIAPLGFGLSADVLALDLGIKVGYEHDAEDTKSHSVESDAKLDVLNQYQSTLTGTLAPITTDPTVDTLPNKTVVDERFGARMFVPAPYGQAFVKSKTLDVYQQKLLQTGTIYGYTKIPNKDIPEDFNIVTFRFNSQYIRPGSLDGIITYDYAANPADPSDYSVSTGQLRPLYDVNFGNAPKTGHDASYKKIVETYNLKKQIDLENFNSLARYNVAYNNKDNPYTGLTNPSNFYNEYVWHARGGLQVVKHTNSSAFEEIYSVSSTSTNTINGAFNAKLSCTAVTVVDLNIGYESTDKIATKYTFDTATNSSFDFDIDVSGLETDTQMRNTSNNDIKYIRQVNENSNITLKSGSDGLVYRSTNSGAENNDFSGLFTNLEPYDRPGKTKLYRWYSFFLQPNKDNADEFFNTVVDPIWLANSTDTDANALRDAQMHPTVPWRLFHRVTYSERFLPPTMAAPMVVPSVQLYVAFPVKDLSKPLLGTSATFTLSNTSILFTGTDSKKYGAELLALAMAGNKNSRDASKVYYVDKSTGNSKISGYKTITGQYPLIDTFKLYGANTEAETVGYVILFYELERPHPNTKYEVNADLGVYKRLSILDMFPTGDIDVVKQLLIADYPQAVFNQLPDGKDTVPIKGPNLEIQQVFASNIIAFFTKLQTNANSV